MVDANRKIRALSAAQLKSERDVGEWLRGIIAEAIREKSREILIKPLPEGAAVSFKKDTFFMSVTFPYLRSCTMTLRFCCSVCQK